MSPIANPHLFPVTGPVARQFGALNGAAYIMVVPAPGEGQIAQVAAITVPNNTAGALTLSLFVNDNAAAPTYTLIDYRAGAFAVGVGDTYTSADRLPVIFLRDFESLVMTCTAAQTPAYYSCWARGIPATSGVPT